MSKILTIFFSAISLFSFAQCPSGNVVLNNQAELDAFAISHAGCTSFTGNLEIKDTQLKDITDLSALTNLDTIWGDLIFTYLRQPIDLNALSNLKYVSGALSITECDSLPSLEGLNNLTEIGGEFTIYRCDSLESLAGLDNLTTIGSTRIFDSKKLSVLSGVPNLTRCLGDFKLENSRVTDLTGLEALETIGGGLTLNYNYLLTSFNGLTNLDSILGRFYITKNNKLTTTQGVVALRSIGSLEILRNDKLAMIDFPTLSYVKSSITVEDSDSIKNFLPGMPSLIELNGYLQVYNTPIESFLGLESLVKIKSGLYALLCPDFTGFYGLENLDTIEGTMSLSQCHMVTDFEGISSLKTVNDLNIINNLRLKNVNCFSQLTSAKNITIKECDSLVSIDSLHNITSVTDVLTLKDNPLLASLNGLENLALAEAISLFNLPKLTSVSPLSKIKVLHEGFLVYNTGIKDFTGMSQLDSINELFYVQYCDSLESFNGLSNLKFIGSDFIVSNDSNLVDMTGLSSLTTITDLIEIYENPKLVSIEGLENLAISVDADVEIYDNDLLTFCAITSVCDYLALNPGGSDIYDNATGCDNETEIQNECSVTSVVDIKATFTVYPNPFNNYLTVEGMNEHSSYTVTDISGRTIITSNSESINTAGWNKGVYFFKVMDNNQSFTYQLVKR